MILVMAQVLAEPMPVEAATPITVLMHAIAPLLLPSMAQVLAEPMPVEAATQIIAQELATVLLRLLSLLLMAMLAPPFPIPAEKQVHQPLTVRERVLP